MIYCLSQHTYDWLSDTITLTTVLLILMVSIVHMMSSHGDYQ